jgi:hypothetical protein
MPENNVAARLKAESLPADRFLAQHPQPVVLNFQPKEFSILTEPEDLQVWQKLLVEEVGLDAKVVDALRSNAGTCCESGSTNDCDVD